MTQQSGEQRWTAMVSIDMVGSTQILQKIGQEKAFALIQEVLSAARTIVELNGGHVIDTAGDGLLAAFGAPRAVENASLQACRAALAFRDKMHRDENALEARFGTLPKFRTGVAGGNVLVVELDAGQVRVVGDSVNLAARLLTEAAPDEIILSDDIMREVDGFVQVTTLDDVEVKGFTTAVRHHRLDGIAAVRSRFEGLQKRGLTAFVSREAELDQVLNDLEGANVVGIVGPAGIGKSRLIFEVMAKLSTQRHVYIGQCAPTGQTAFGPLHSIVRQASPAPTGAPFGTVLTDLLKKHPNLCDPDLIASVAGPVDAATDPLNRVLQERAALLAVLRGLHRETQAVFVLEDAHWIDESTHDLINILLDDPVPMIVTSRPIAAPRWLADIGRRTLVLEPLENAAIATIVEARFIEPVSPPLAQMIAEKSEGIPLIAEEIARALQQSGAIKDHGRGLEVVDEKQSLLTGNVQQLVLSRVDRLPPDQKRLLQFAAAIGRDFTTPLLVNATDAKDVLQSLESMAGLVDPLGDDAWRFTHALIRDAVYAGLLTDQRIAIHEAIGCVLETRGGTAPQLAYHFSQSQNAAKAAQYLIETANGHLQSYALAETDRTLKEAMAWIDGDPDIISDDAFAKMAETWLRALNHAAQYGRSKEVAAQIFPRLSAMPYNPNVAMARMFEAMAMTHRRDYKSAHINAKQTLADAQDAGDALGAAWAKVTLMRIYDETHCAPLTAVEKLAKEVEPVAQAYQDRHLGMTALYLLSTVYRSAGRRSEALRVADELETAAQTNKDRRARAFSQWSRAVIYATEGNPEATLEMVHKSMREAIPGTADYLASICIEMSARAFLEPHDAVRPDLTVLLQDLKPLDDYNLIHAMKWVEVVMLIRHGKLAQGWRLLNGLVADATQKGNVNLTRQFHISRAEVLLAILGLTDPDSEEPADRPRFPKARPGLADIWTFATLRLTAKRQAEVSLQAYYDEKPGRAGTHDARASINLGLIAKADKDHAKAKTLLTAGLQSAKAEGLHFLLQRAEKGLDGL